MPRGRKVDSDGEVTRKLLLEKAIEAFAEYGYNATKISDIVTKAEVTQPTLYLYFNSKEAIFKEITNYFQDQLIQLMDISLLEENIAAHSLKKEIHIGLINTFRFYLENPLLTQIGFFEAESANELKMKMVNKLYETLLSEQRRGYLSDDYRMRLVAESLIGSIERLTINELLTKKSTPEELADELVQIYFGGIHK